jgi:hypothetical protein
MSSKFVWSPHIVYLAILTNIESFLQSKYFSSSRLISLNRMLEFDQNILSKYSLKEASLDFKTTERQRKYMFCSRMRCDPKKKCKMAKIHNKMIDNSSPFLDQLFWQYLCLAKHFLSFVNLRMFW